MTKFNGSKKRERPESLSEKKVRMELMKAGDLETSLNLAKLKLSYFPEGLNTKRKLREINKGESTTALNLALEPISIGAGVVVDEQLLMVSFRTPPLVSKSGEINSGFQL